jgi:predicted fused transcriptional regulator/phosphomethylpyrimidine kinase
MAMASQNATVIPEVASNMVWRVSQPETGDLMSASGRMLRGAVLRLRTAGPRHTAIALFTVEKGYWDVASIGDRLPRQSGSSIFEGEALR